MKLLILLITLSSLYSCTNDQGPGNGKTRMQEKIDSAFNRSK